MITNKLIKITVLLYWTSLIVHWVAAAFQVTMNRWRRAGNIVKNDKYTYRPWRLRFFSDFFFSIVQNRLKTNIWQKRPNYYENAVGVSCRHIAWSRLRDSRARGIEEARTQKREETGERRGCARLSLSRLQFPTLLRLTHFLRAWNRRVDRRQINLLIHATNCVSYIGTFSQQNRKSRVGWTLDKPFWA